MLSKPHEFVLIRKGRFDPELLARFGIESQENNLAIPRQDEDGLTIGTRLIAMDPRGYAAGLGNVWRATGERYGRPRLWNEAVMRDPAFAGRRLVICESELDALAVIQAGHPYAIAPDNGPFDEGDHEGMSAFVAAGDLIAQAGEILLAMRDNPRGVAFREVLLGWLGKGRCSIMPPWPPECGSLADVLAKYGAEGVAPLLDMAKPYPLRGVYRLSDYPEAPDLRFYGSDVPGLKLNLFRGGLVTVAGIASHGKSTAVNAILGDLICKHGLRVGLGSLEMRIKPFVRDALRRYHRGRSEGIRDMRRVHEIGTGQLTAAQIEAADAWIEQHWTFLDLSATLDGELPTIDWFLQSADDAIARYGMDCLVLDPWNKVDFGDVVNHHRAEIRALNRLKQYAEQRNIVLIVVTHPSLAVRGKDGEARAPSMLDIAGGAHWSAMSDQILIAHRPDLSKQLVELHVKKAKFYGSGEVGVYRVLYQRAIEYFLPAPDEPAEADDDPLTMGF